ncbi:unnamed protein product, partial [Prorocentrum cordatum]
LGPGDRDRFAQEGLLHLRGVFAGGARRRLLQAARRLLERLWGAPPRGAVEAEPTAPGQYGFGEPRDLGSIPRLRRRVLRRGGYRLYLNFSSPALRAWTALLLDPRVLCRARALTGGRPLRVNGLAFERGTQQALHADT